jgi:predicted glycoside hydrolase/deacetylase ChbG (UPF0249 family)
MRRILIVNADDFGQSPGVNRGIVDAHRNGIVTSASLMVRHAAAGEAIALSRSCPALSVGLHIDLGEWRLCDGEWIAVYNVVPFNDRPAVEEEVMRQLAAFRRIAGRDPTHIDSHQHVHLREPLRGIATALAREVAVPLRRASDIRYCGDFYGQDADGSPRPERIGAAALLELVEGLPAGITELCCHPAAHNDLDSMYGVERVRELEALCDSRMRDAIVRNGIALCSFREVHR